LNVASSPLGVAAVVALAAAAGPASAFHSGGVGACDGCHSMHGQLEGEAMVTGAAPGDGSGPYLLRASDPSGACLNCHATPDLVPSSFHVATLGIEPAGIPAQMTPGGDFAWVRLGWRNSGKTGLYPFPNHRHGHNVVAADLGWEADRTLAAAPGGDYPAASLHCSSCHDPHGRYRRFADGAVATGGLPIFGSGSYDGSEDPVAGVSTAGVYRLLGGAGYQPRSLAGDHAFAAPPPDAVAPSTYNRLETAQPTQTFVAYGRGMSEWCGNCHRAFVEGGYTSGMGGLHHPSGAGAKLTQAVVASYGAYVTSGVMTNTDPSRAYSTLTPFEVGTGDYAALKARASPSGAVDRSPTAQDNVACVSCHRAHAGGFDSLLRFSLASEFMTEEDPAGIAMYARSGLDATLGDGYTATLAQAAYYGRPAAYFGRFARVQCNKCHAKD
jgi:hypothetical protein